MNYKYANFISCIFPQWITALDHCTEGGQISPVLFCRWKNRSISSGLASDYTQQLSMWQLASLHVSLVQRTRDTVKLTATWIIAECNQRLIA